VSEVDENGKVVNQYTVDKPAEVSGSISGSRASIVTLGSTLIYKIF